METFSSRAWRDHSSFCKILKHGSPKCNQQKKRIGQKISANLRLSLRCSFWSCDCSICMACDNKFRKKRGLDITLLAWLIWSTSSNYWRYTSLTNRFVIVPWVPDLNKKLWHWPMEKINVLVPKECGTFGEWIKGPQVTNSPQRRCLEAQHKEALS